MNMIDFHSHILPNIDDGASNIEETMLMLKEAKSAGFSSVISTSHFIEETYNVSSIKRDKIINEITKIIQLENIDIKIYNGSETYISNNLDKLLNENILTTINNSRYLLIELPMNNRVLFLDEVIFDLLADGIIPIIAHPERYSYIQESPNILLDLIKKGVLFQANYGSIIGQYGKRAQSTVKKLLKHNMIHFLGTDAHKSNNIYTKMNIILNKLERLIGKEKLEKLSTTNPTKVINNQKIEIDKPTKIKKLFI